LVKKQICKLEDPSLDCVELVHEELQKIIQDCGSEKKLSRIFRFPILQYRILEVARNLLQFRLALAKDRIKEMLAVELAYINTKHPDFHPDIKMSPEKDLRPEAPSGFSFGMKGPEVPTGFSFGKPEPARLSSKVEETVQDRDRRITENLIKSYFVILKKSFQDSVSKVIMHHLVNYVQDNLYTIMVRRKSLKNIRLCSFSLRLIFFQGGRTVPRG